MNRPILLVLGLALAMSFRAKANAHPPVAFGEGGQIKMLYDRRQRPQSIYIGGKVHIVFNAGGDLAAEPKVKTRPMAITYDPATREFSDIVTLGKASRDHHDGPVIWSDKNDRLHVLFGCHKSPGTHLISKQPASIGCSLNDWSVASQIAPALSYPTVYQVADDRQLVHYRTFGHTSSWTYRITADNGKTWSGPKRDVTDMDIHGRLDWSSYQSRLLSGDRRHLHVAFFTYDDVKTNPDPQRRFNPRYGKEVPEDNWKYNLYYICIDLDSGEVANFEGQQLTTPIDLDQADRQCRIWNTQGRGAGVPPTLIEDANGDPAFLHQLSEDTLSEHNYYYYHRRHGRWKATRIASSNHQWNSCHLHRQRDGVLDAYLIRGAGHLNTGGYMDKHGGGRIEQWSSADEGETWTMARDVTPEGPEYRGWKFNNPRHVTCPDGTPVDNMLLFYGWPDENACAARAFLWHESTE